MTPHILCHLLSWSQSLNLTLVQIIVFISDFTFFPNPQCWVRGRHNHTLSFFSLAWPIPVVSKDKELVPSSLIHRGRWLFLCRLTNESLQEGKGHEEALRKPAQCPVSKGGKSRAESRRDWLTQGPHSTAGAGGADLWPSDSQANKFTVCCTVSWGLSETGASN